MVNGVSWFIVYVSFSRIARGGPGPDSALFLAMSQEPWPMNKQDPVTIN